MAFHFSAVRHQAIIGTSAGTVLIGPLGNPLQWRHNGLGSVSNHQPHDCLLNRLFRRRSKKTTKIRVTGLCAGNSPIPVNSPHKGPVTRKMFPFDDVIMWWNQDAVAIMQENENVVFRSFCFASWGVDMAPVIPRHPVNSPHKGQWRGALIFSLIYVWINGWVNNREAGDLRRYRAHYDVIVMSRSTQWLLHVMVKLSATMTRCVGKTPVSDAFPANRASNAGPRFSIW